MTRQYSFSQELLTSEIPSLTIRELHGDKNHLHSRPARNVLSQLLLLTVVSINAATGVKVITRSPLPRLLRSVIPCRSLLTIWNLCPLIRETNGTDMSNKWHFHWVGYLTTTNFRSKVDTFGLWIFFNDIKILSGYITGFVIVKVGWSEVKSIIRYLASIRLSIRISDRRFILMLLYSPVDSTGNVNLIERC